MLILFPTHHHSRCKSHELLKTGLLMQEFSSLKADWFKDNSLFLREHLNMEL